MQRLLSIVHIRPRGLLCLLSIYDPEGSDGNVFEWCLDWYGAFSPDAVSDPVGPLSSSYRVNHGGGFANDAGYCRVSFHIYNGPDGVSNATGFRVALPSGQ